MGGGGLRLSVERRRIENAKLSAQRYRRFQEFHKHIQEKEMRKALEVLEHRKKECEWLNNYIHSLHPTQLKPHNLRFQSNEEFNKRNQYIQRPPWTFSYLKHNIKPSISSQKENSLADVELFGLQQPDYDVMLQICATSVRDALVDLRACNSRYPINDVDQYKSPLVEDSYLRNHFLRAGEPRHNSFSNPQRKQCNLQVVVNDNCSISKLHIDGTYHANKVSTQSLQEDFNKCKTIADANVIFQGNCSYNSKANDSKNSLHNTSSTETLTKFWQCHDGETTSFLTKELLLSSLKSEVPTSRLVEEIKTPCSNYCRLIPIPCNNYFCSKTSLDHFTNNIENQTTNVHIKSNQHFQNEVSKSVHGVFKTECINDIKLTSDEIQKTQFMNYHNTSSCFFDEKDKHCIIFKDNETLISNKQHDMESKEAKYCNLEELHNSSSQVLCASNHEVSQKKENTSAGIKSRCSSQNEVRSKDSIENQGRTNASSSTTNINQEVHLYNSSGIKNQPHVGSKKLNIPQHILQSVYERCDLDAIKNHGYAHLCDASHFKKEINSKSLNHNNLSNDVNNLTLEEITSTSSYSNDANLHNHEKTTIDVESLYHNFSRNEEDLGKENLYTDLCSPSLEEELNILASLERLDWKLAAISGRSLNSERNSLTSQGGQLSSKSAQSAPAIMTHDGPSSTTLGKKNLAIGKPKKNCSMPPRPSSARMIPKKPPISHRQRRVVGVTNKSQGRSIHQLHLKSEVCIPPSHLFTDESNKIRPSSPGSIVCYKDPHCLLNSPTPHASGIII